MDAIRQGNALVLECRRQLRSDQAALDASAKLLKVVPEVRRPGRAVLWQAATRPRCTLLHAQLPPPPPPPRKLRAAEPNLAGPAHVAQIYTIWNYRRELLGPAFKAGGEQAAAAASAELALTQVRLPAQWLRPYEHAGADVL